MKRTYLHILCGATLLLAMASCIRENLQDCPPLSVRIDIEDKNYANAAETEAATGLALTLPEDQPFRHYIQKLYYTLYSMDSAKVVLTQHLHDVQGDAMTATAYLPSELDFGRYVLVVWGNIDSEDGIQRQGGYYDLHAGNVEGYDVYMTCDTLLYDDTHYDYTVSLRRVKGQLLIQAEGIPDGIAHSRKAVSRVSGGVDRQFRYEEEEAEYLVTDTPLDGLVQDGRAVSRTAVAPTLPGHESGVYLRFFADPADAEPALSVDGIPVTLRRNEISVLRYVYDDGTGSFEVYSLIDDRWQAVHQLGLEE